jgi:hypothetical protein
VPVRLAIANREALERAALTRIDLPQAADRLTIGLTKQARMAEETGALESRAQGQLTLQDAARTRAEHDASILPRFRSISIYAGDACFGYAQDAIDGIVIHHRQRQLFGGAQAGEEAELIIISLRLRASSCPRSMTRPTSRSLHSSSPSWRRLSKIAAREQAFGVEPSGGTGLMFGFCRVCASTIGPLAPDI